VIGLGSGISGYTEFNRRARVALRGFDRLNPFLESIAGLLDRGRVLTPKQQQAFINAIHQNRRQISDALLRDFAATHARGAD
jgi:hypothetical protein